MLQMHYLNSYTHNFTIGASIQERTPENEEIGEAYN